MIKLILFGFCLQAQGSLIQSVSVGEIFVCAIFSGKINCWNYNKPLTGSPPLIDLNSFQIQAPSPFVKPTAIAVANGGFCALDEGAVKCAGNFVIPTPKDRDDTSTTRPFDINPSSSELTGLQLITATLGDNYQSNWGGGGPGTFCAIKISGELFCWGATVGGRKFFAKAQALAGATEMFFGLAAYDNIVLYINNGAGSQTWTLDLTSHLITGPDYENIRRTSTSSELKLQSSSNFLAIGGDFYLNKNAIGNSMGPGFKKIDLDFLIGALDLKISDGVFYLRYADRLEAISYSFNGQNSSFWLSPIKTVVNKPLGGSGYIVMPTNSLPMCTVDQEGLSCYYKRKSWDSSIVFTELKVPDLLKDQFVIYGLGKIETTLEYLSQFVYQTKANFLLQLAAQLNETREISDKDALRIMAAFLLRPLLETTDSEYMQTIILPRYNQFMKSVPDLRITKASVPFALKSLRSVLEILNQSGQHTNELGRIKTLVGIALATPGDEAKLADLIQALAQYQNVWDDFATNRNSFAFSTLVQLIEAYLQKG